MLQNPCKTGMGVQTPCHSSGSAHVPVRTIFSNVVITAYIA